MRPTSSGPRNESRNNKDTPNAPESSPIAGPFSSQDNRYNYMSSYQNRPPLIVSPFYFIGNRSPAGSSSWRVASPGGRPALWS